MAWCWRLLCFLVGELDIDVCSYRLNGASVLGMVDKVSEASLEFWIPLEEVELDLLEGLASVSR